ncbi:hypothetical protein Pan216_11170 [Planctomycetes bacterium Pan216]|uniref:Uncharacterized protein n=1 Tax=Kolteria novifilia TaxID=2527975 RepID=A0A518AZW0_9BACT|nr:hypothetical protein Pan216_11170 [Planctomycetes bacterium Pan216]
MPRRTGQQSNWCMILVGLLIVVVFAITGWHSHPPPQVPEPTILETTLVGLVLVVWATARWVTYGIWGLLMLGADVLMFLWLLFPPRLQNLWVDGGSGRLPRL